MSNGLGGNQKNMRFASLTRPPLRYFSNFADFWVGREADYFKFQSQVYSMKVFKNVLATYVFYDAVLGMMNKMRNL